MEPLVQRIVARFLEAGRYVNVSPMKLGPCEHCGGDGVHVDGKFNVKILCIKCFGTGTSQKDLRALQNETEELETRYEKDKGAFSQEKKEWGPGRSNPSFGRSRGKNLQTLHIKAQARRKQLDEEMKRLELGKDSAKTVGAAASR